MPQPATIANSAAPSTWMTTSATAAIALCSSNGCAVENRVSSAVHRSAPVARPIASATSASRTANATGKRPRVQPSTPSAAAVISTSAIANARTIDSTPRIARV
jgi:hypothetical protein